MDKLIENYSQFWPFLANRIAAEADKKFEGSAGIGKLKSFLSYLGNPQNKIPTIHIAGTAGKGSTAYYIASLLKEHGFRVGLTVSPHILDVRERLQIDLAYPNEELILKAFQAFQTKLFEFEAEQKLKFHYHKLNIAFAYYFYATQVELGQTKLDYLVIETGIGGRFDSTNVIDKGVDIPEKISVITHIDFDHMEILGYSLAEIARQKAGIFLPDSTAISAPQSPEIKRILEIEAALKNAGLQFINDQIHYPTSPINPIPNHFNYLDNQLNVQDIILSLPGIHQIENANLALTTFKELAKRDHFKVVAEKIRTAFSTVRIPGRMQIIKHKNATIILDGAHNPAKMTALVETLETIYPNQKFQILFANSPHHQPDTILPLLFPIANEICITNSNSHLDQLPTELLAKRLKQETELREYMETRFPDKIFNYEIDPFAALTRYIKRTEIQTNPDPILITGSFFLVSAILVNFQFNN